MNKVFTASGDRGNKTITFYIGDVLRYEPTYDFYLCIKIFFRDGTMFLANTHSSPDNFFNNLKESFADHYNEK